MNFPLAAAALVFLTAALVAESDLARELMQVKEQHEKAVQTALEPLNRRYATSLQQLLRRATQAGELELAMKIKQALLAVPTEITPVTAANPYVGIWRMATPDGSWTQLRALKADGTFVIGDETKPGGTWKVEKGTLTLRSSVQPGNFERFQLPLKDGKLEGESHTGTRFTLRPGE